MVGTSKRRNYAAVQEREVTSPILATLGRLVLAVLVPVLLTFLFLPLSFMLMTGKGHLS